MKPQVAKRLALIGCIPLSEPPIGFALPIFRRSMAATSWVVQDTDELSGRVSGFRVFEGDNKQILHISGLTAGIGDEQLYAFVTAESKVVAGTLATIGPALKQFADLSLLHPSIVLQIRELIGSAEEKKTARARMQMILLQQQGSAAARSFYEGSVLRSILWDKLVGAATSTEMARRIIRSRGRLSARLRNGSIELELAALSDEDLAELNINEIVTSMLLEFEPQPSKSLETTSNQILETSDQVMVGNLLKRVSATGRQEERVAMLIAAILDDPKVGKSVLLRYGDDRAKTAAWATKELRKLLLDTNWPSEPRIVAALIPQLFSQHYPMTRGELLFSLAKHLGKWPEIRQAIRDILSKTQSTYVGWFRNDIEQTLRENELRGQTQ